MKPLKIILSVVGLLGLVACFLPYFSEEGMKMSYWDFHKMPSSPTEGLINGPHQVYIAMACFAVVLVMGIIAFATKVSRWQGIVALVFSVLAFAPEGVRKGLSGEHDVHPAIGGKLLFVAAVLGIISGILAIAMPEKN